MTDTPILSLRHLCKTYGTTVPARDFSIDIARGEFFTMLGPSGSGKSTILRLIAGLEQPDQGEIIIDGKDMTATPPWERRLGMVFQHYAVFPHMDVARNVGYGLRRDGLSRTAMAARVSELLALVGLAGFEARRVHQLSGGEQQRVAIARALAQRPDILLLDEPLSALDEKIRREMQTELTSIQKQTGTTFIYVTHDQEEALTMSDRIAVLNDGRYVQCGAPEAIFRAPATPFVAEFFRGANVLTASIEAVSETLARVRLGDLDLQVPRQSRTGDAQRVAIRGEAIEVGPQATESEVTLQAEVVRITYRGLYTAVELRLPDRQKLTAIHRGAVPLEEGEKTPIGLKISDVVLLDND